MRRLFYHRGSHIRRGDVLIVLANEFKNKLIEMGSRGKIITETTTVDDEVFAAMTANASSKAAFGTPWRAGHTPVPYSTG